MGLKPGCDAFESGDVTFKIVTVTAGDNEIFFTHFCGKPDPPVRLASANQGYGRGRYGLNFSLIHFKKLAFEVRFSGSPQVS